METYRDPGPLINELRADIRALTRKVDRIHGVLEASQPPSQTADHRLPAVEVLPERIVKGLYSALGEQHRAIMHEMGQLRRQMAVDSKQADRNPAQPPPASERKEILAHVDARFEWLTNELSQRFVVLGNAVARIERHLRDDHKELSAGGKSVERMMAPVLSEIDRLSRGLAEAIDLLHRDEAPSVGDQ